MKGLQLGVPNRCDFRLDDGMLCNEHAIMAIYDRKSEEVMLVCGNHAGEIAKKNRAKRHTTCPNCACVSPVY